MILNTRSQYESEVYFKRMPSFRAGLRRGSAAVRLLGLRVRIVFCKCVSRSLRQADRSSRGVLLSECDHEA